MGESIQQSTTRNPIKHITINNNKEYTRLRATGWGVQIINKRNTEWKTLNETYRIQWMTGNRWRETGTRTRPDQTHIYTKLDRQFTEWMQETDRKQKVYRIKELARNERTVWTIYTQWGMNAGILGSEEELNNYERWITHEGNHDITRVTRYVDRITHKP